MKTSKELENFIGNIAERFFIKNPNIDKDTSFFNTQFTKALKAELVKLSVDSKNKQLIEELARFLKSEPYFIPYNDPMTSMANVTMLKETGAIKDNYVFIYTEKGKHCSKAWSELAKKHFKSKNQ
ncbi:MAG: hypothetical protein KQH79_17455 [Bacteroidetes bacterium]|nr:hypothetical protein [Bacteroidota bacterium]